MSITMKKAALVLLAIGALFTTMGGADLTAHENGRTLKGETEAQIKALLGEPDSDEQFELNDGVLVHLPINGISTRRDFCFSVFREGSALMGRFDLTDFEWSVIEPLLPTKVRGVKRLRVRPH